MGPRPARWPSRIGHDEDPSEEAPAEEIPTRIVDLLVGFGEVEILGVDDAPTGRPGADIRALRISAGSEAVEEGPVGFAGSTRLMGQVF